MSDEQAQSHNKDNLQVSPSNNQQVSACRNCGKSPCVCLGISEQAQLAAVNEQARLADIQEGAKASNGERKPPKIRWI